MKEHNNNNCSKKHLKQTIFVQYAYVLFQLSIYKSRHTCHSLSLFYKVKGYFPTQLIGKGGLERENVQVGTSSEMKRGSI